MKNGRLPLHTCPNLGVITINRLVSCLKLVRAGWSGWRAVAATGCSPKTSLSWNVATQEPLASLIAICPRRKRSLWTHSTTAANASRVSVSTNGFHSDFCINRSCWSLQSPAHTPIAVPTNVASWKRIGPSVSARRSANSRRKVQRIRRNRTIPVGNYQIWQTKD